ncbi:MAG TPA: hypothetical protein VJ836_04780 [Candidatus Saccharimonadales bacterium]|nr:hypothetical protein [Candidatus Saccharimonadales bacterium]
MSAEVVAHPELVVRPGLVVPSWSDFIATHPPFSIALDGYVNAGPDYEQAGPYANFDHHTGVKRMATLATSQQILRCMRVGLVPAFTNENNMYQPIVHANHPDHDVSLSWSLLQNAPEWRYLEGVKRQRLRELVSAEGVLDVFGGAYPYDDPHTSIIRKIAGIFEPYTNLDHSGEIRQQDPARYKEVIEQINGNIALYLEGQGPERDLELDYERIGGGVHGEWVMIKETGRDGRIQAFYEGIDAYVIFRGESDVAAVDGQGYEETRYHYTVGRQSEFVRFDVPGIIDHLNDTEGLQRSRDHWGGSEIIGGSPRHEGSKLPPQELSYIINVYLKTMAEGRV